MHVYKHTHTHHIYNNNKLDKTKLISKMLVLFSHHSLPRVDKKKYGWCIILTSFLEASLLYFIIWNNRSWQYRHSQKHVTTSGWNLEKHPSLPFRLWVFNMQIDESSMNLQAYTLRHCPQHRCLGAESQSQACVVQSLPRHQNGHDSQVQRHRLPPQLSWLHRLKLSLSEPFAAILKRC